MTHASRAPATRSNMLRLRRSVAQVMHGAALLKKKRQSLVLELFDRARPAIDARVALEERAQAAYRALLEALAASGQDGLHVLGWPSRELKVDLVPLEVGGIRGFELASRPALVRTVAARGGAMGEGDAAASAAAEQFERLLEILLEIAPEDAFLRRLARELRHVTRLVNTLEQRVVPSLSRGLAGMRRTLDEREREDHMRLRRTGVDEGRTR